MIDVAIITPTLRSDFLMQRACVSLSKNTKKNIRITHFIIFDNAEISCPKITKNKNYNLVLLKNVGLNGPSAARNVGLSKLTDDFDYFGFLDADDYLSENYIENSIRKLQKSMSTVVFGQGLISDANSRPVKYSNVPIDEGNVEKKLIAINIIGCPSGVIICNNIKNRSVFFDTDLRYLEDYFYYLSLTKHDNKFLKTDEKYFYQVHNNQATKPSNIEQLADQLLNFLGKVKYLELSFIDTFLIKLRVKISKARLSRRYQLEALLAIFLMSILCSRWLIGRINMWKKG